MKRKDPDPQKCPRNVAILAEGAQLWRCLQSLRAFNRDYQCQVRSLVFCDREADAQRFARNADVVVPWDSTAVPESWNFLYEELKLHQVDMLWLDASYAEQRGPLSEICASLKITMLGSQPLDDNALTFKHKAAQLDIPLLPWQELSLNDPERAALQAENLGFPLKIIAAARHAEGETWRVARKEDWAEAFEKVVRLATRESICSDFYVEAFKTDGRLLAIPILRDAEGRVQALNAVEVVEEAGRTYWEEMPASDISSELIQQLQSWSCQLMKAEGAAFCGSLRFLYEPETDKAWLLDTRPYLAEHEVLLEESLGIDIGKTRLFLAAGGTLSHNWDTPRSHFMALSLPIKARDPSINALRLNLFRPMLAAGVQMESWVREGDLIQAGSSLGTLLCRGSHRAETRERVMDALKESKIVLEGGSLDKDPVLKRVKRALGDIFELRDPPKELFFVVAGLELYREHIETEQSTFYKNAARGRPSLRTESASFLHLTLGEQTVPLKIARLGPELYQLRIQGHALMLRYHKESAWERRLQFVNGPLLPVLVHADSESFSIEIEGVQETVGRPHMETVRAPGPGVIQSIRVKTGDRVHKGESLLTLEAMKMELAVTAPCDGLVQQVFVVTNTPALRGSALLQLQTSPSALPLSQADAAFQPWLQHASESIHGLEGLYLKAVLLGYDVELDVLPSELRSYQQHLATLDIPDAQAAIYDLLRSFTTIKGLFRKHPHPLPEDELEHFASEDHVITYLRTLQKTAALPAKFLTDLEQALRLYIENAADEDAQRDALYWLYQSKCAETSQLQIVTVLLESLRTLPVPLGPSATQELRCLQDLQHIAQNRFQNIYELCLHLKYSRFEKTLFERSKHQSLAQAEQLLTQLEREPHRRDLWQALIDAPYSLGPMLMQRLAQGTATQKVQILGLLLSRYYYQHHTDAWHEARAAAVPSIACQLQIEHKPGVLTALYLDHRATENLRDHLLLLLEREAHGGLHYIEIFLAQGHSPAAIQAELQNTGWPENLGRVTLHGLSVDAETCEFLTLVRGEDGRLYESTFFKNFHPSFADRLQLERWRHFKLERLPSAPSIFLFRAVARQNPKDERLVAVAEVRDLQAIRDADGRVMSLPHLEHLVSDAFASIRSVQMDRPRNRLHWNVIELRVWPVLDFGRQELYQIARSLARGSEHLGLEKLLWRGPVKDPATGQVHDRCLEFKKPSGMDLTIHDLAPSNHPVEALTEYQQKVVKLRQRSLIYPYELIRMFCPEDGAQSKYPEGHFQEYDLVDGILEPVNRPWGQNRSNIVVGTIRHYTERYPEGMQRVVLLGDPSRGLGNLSEPECRRIITALDLAEASNAPLEWFAISSGAKIAMDSGTENMDWIAAALRKIIDFTQRGGEINIVVMGINVGAQPYWNAEATMLMHTKGILIMLPQSAMVLTGKRALDYSGGVSAEDDLGIGGYSRIMGINGQAQYFAQDVAEACTILLQHYEYSFVAPGERFPRPVMTQDPIDRDVCSYPHGGEFSVVGQVFSNLDNPGRKKPFEIRQIMRATIDQDHPPLERWADMLDAENAVVWDAHLGGYPVCLLGIESKPIHRKGTVHADGPEQWTGGTLFPLASKKIARAINAASAVRPLVVLANLSGFDGSPESMRRCQLEFGAEIGRAVVNFSGPIVFCVVSRFHGGAYVVFSKTLNDNLQILALDGTFASVIGGAPAAGVVFAGEVELRTQQHPDIALLQEALKKAEGAQKKDLYKQLEMTLRQVRALMVGQIAEEFDREHSVQRALQVGSLHRIIAPERLRPEVIAALERGMTLEKNRVQSELVDA